MATKIYDIASIELADGTVLELEPLKIKYLREFMILFEKVKAAKGDSEAIAALVECSVAAMKQYHPSIKTVEDAEDLMTMPAIYKLIDVAAGIRVDDKEKDKSVKDQATESGTTWEKFDLATLEAEVFLLGIWKDYDDLEKSLSMPELIATLEAKRKDDYAERKFLAALQGVDLDKETGGTGAVEENPQDIWERKKAKFLSGGMTSDPNDILSLSGKNAQRTGFGIGAGLDYVKV